MFVKGAGIWVMFVIDASVWVSVFLLDDAHHQESSLWMDQTLRDRTPIQCPAILLPEVAGPVSRRARSARLGHDAIRYLMALPQLTIVPMSSELALSSARLAANLNLKGADAVYVALADICNATLVTLDDEQRTRASQIVPAMRLSEETVS